ncbi:hypothetical protein E1193_11255 [Micromonospora sp. KC606]|uniref:hypothetical protein n=1 Tax=Micromonospora sp. KC606 TaxID=2530379 RepID=UPI001046D0F8|nr:hypothetical protein [Micromonospora sp. KC606]TDC82661.1 hypothetical protein E1193_11255 [Micromonospora sp. KC606]
MNAEQLRETLRSELAASNPPPPPSTAAALSAGRRALIRRRTAWACTGSAAAVLAIAGVAAIPGPAAETYRPAGPGPQAVPGPLANATTGPRAVPHPSATDTKEPWPTGPDGQPQEDRTARAGTRHDQGARLLDQILTVVPPGYTAPENPANQPAGQEPLREHQAQFDKKVNGVEVWSYLSSATLAQGERKGRLFVEVHTRGNELPTEPCALAQKFWGMQGECQVETVGARKAGVVVRPTGDDRLDQWAAYRHPDGVVVFVAQSRGRNGGGTELAKLPFTVEQLAALATDDRFHLS